MSNLVTLAQSLDKKRAEVEKLQQEIEELRARELTSLPGQVGLESVDELIKALAAYASPRIKGLLGGKSTPAPRAPRQKRSATPAEPKAEGQDAGGRRPRTTITEEIRTRVVALVNEGKTAAEIAAEVGISVPSVANIKKAAGLTKPRA
jgi:DNA-binding NarL/FixJ family response regulator